MEARTITLDFWTTLTIIKAYKQRVSEIDKEATDRWGEYYYENINYRYSRLAEERDICALMINYYIEDTKKSICLN